jgi:hypothetical protein
MWCHWVAIARYRLRQRHCAVQSNVQRRPAWETSISKAPSLLGSPCKSGRCEDEVEPGFRAGATCREAGAMVPNPPLGARLGEASLSLCDCHPRNRHLDGVDIAARLEDEPLARAEMCMGRVLLTTWCRPMPIARYRLRSRQIRNIPPLTHNDRTAHGVRFVPILLKKPATRPLGTLV